MKRLNLLIFFISFSLIATYAQTTIITDGAWKGVGNSISSNGTDWLYQGYDDSAWPTVEAPNIANVIPVVAGSQSIWVLPYSDTAKMRKTFVVPVGDAYGGSISINADNEFELFFNGVSQGFYNNWMDGPFVFNISPVLQGCVQNVIAINAANWGGPYGASLSTTLLVTNPLNTPVAQNETNVSCTSFTANWDSVPTANFYLLDVSTDPLFGSFYGVYHDFNVGSSLSSVLSSLPPGVTYYYRLRCQRGTLISCYSNTITVDLDDPNVSYLAPDTLCAGETITLQLMATGSTVHWTGPGGFSSTDTISQITNTSALNTGNYIYTVNYPGCPAIIDTVNIQVIDNPALSISSSSPYCSTGSVDTLVSNISSVIWSGAGITNTSQGWFNPGLAGGGPHTIQCVTGGHCPDTASMSVTVSINAGYTISGSDTLCNGDDIHLQSTSGAGSVISWTGPNGYASANNNNTIAQATNINSGIYILTVNYTACPVAHDTLQVTVLDYPDPGIVPAGPFCNNGSVIHLTGNPSGGTWVGTGITDPVAGVFDPVVAGTGNHSIQYIISGHCPFADTTIVNVMNSVSLSAVIFPNVFTPNSDGQNDLYSPKVPVGGHYQMVIFDRWGVEIFNRDTDIAWDGKIGNSVASEGTYYWICKITSDCSPEPMVEKGFLQIFKP
jgi:gliding motility-associated-like protein